MSLSDNIALMVPQTIGLVGFLVTFPAALAGAYSATKKRAALMLYLSTVVVSLIPLHRQLTVMHLGYWWLRVKGVPLIPLPDVYFGY
jgi:hypothetical protein